MQTFLKILISIIIPIMLKLVDLVKWWLEKNPDVREKFDAFLKRHAGTVLKLYIEAMSKRQAKERTKKEERVAEKPDNGVKKPAGERDKDFVDSASETAEAAARKAKTVAGEVSKKAGGLLNQLKNRLFPPEEPVDPEKDELEELKRRVDAERKTEQEKKKAQELAPAEPPVATPPSQEPEEGVYERCRRIVEEERRKRNNPPSTDENE